MEIELEIYSNKLTVGPQGRLALDDQEIDMYEDLFYPIRSELPQCPADTFPTIQVSKGTASKFLVWN